MLLRSYDYEELWALAGERLERVGREEPGGAGRRRQGAIHVTVFGPYWIVNKTGLLILFKQ